MIRLSKRLLYTIETVLDVALHEEEGLVRMADLAERAEIAPRYLEPVLQQLVREGVLEGRTGPNGGYSLRRPAHRISLGDIVRIVDGLGTGEDPLSALSGGLGARVVRPLWEEFESEMLRQLDAMSVADVMERAQPTRRRAKGSDD